MSDGAKIRVLHLGSPNGLYGAERWILALVRYLPAERVQSTVATIKDAPGPTPALVEQAARLGVETCVLEAHGKISMRAVSMLRRFLREAGIQILHTHGYKTDVIGYLAARGTKCRIVSTPHGWSKDEGPKVRAYEALDRLFLSLFDAVAPLSAGLYDDLARVRRMKSRLRLIENGMDLSEVSAATELSPEMRAWRRDGDVVVGYIGRLVKPKGIPTLIEAFAHLPIARKRLCILGEGPERQDLERLANVLGIGDRTSFLGYRPDRFEWLKGFHAFVLPSESEGVPRCVLEAMAARVPVVAADIAGCRALVQDSVTGLLFAPKDALGLSDRLVSVLTDSNLRQKIIEAGEALVSGRYSAEIMAGRYAELYSALLEDASRLLPEKKQMPTADRP